METMSSRSKARRYDVAWVILIVAVATLAGMIVQWRAPGLSLYARDWLTRSRGELAEPDDIVIVAIDDESIAKLGRFPWPRGYSARLLDSISAAHPKSISLDVLFTEPSDQTADDLLAAAIKNAGNVVIPAQLTEQRDAPETSRSKWLEPLPSIGASAAGIGHVNVETESDGGARELLLKLSDDNGDGRWALAIETIRVGDNLNSDDITESAKYVRLGTRKIPFISAEWNIFLKNQDADSRFSIATPLRMNIDYIGPTGSYAAQTYSFSDVLDGKISPDKFRNKYVLIGATAATLGDRIATPFVHTESADGDQHGDLMPGVEILANTINTILRGRFYQPVSDWTAAMLAALISIAVIIFLGLAQGNFEAFKQIGVLAALFGLVLAGSYLIFVYAFVIPPLVPVLASFAVATPLALLRRSLAASFNLDERIAELLMTENLLFSTSRDRGYLTSSGISKDSDDNSLAQQKFAVGKFYWPKGIEWKSKTLGFLSRDLIDHAAFVDSALLSIQDGLLIADVNGQIIFANHRALEIFDLPSRRVIGLDIFRHLAENEEDSTETMDRLLIDQKVIEREITIGKIAPRYYFVRMAPVIGRENEDGRTRGIVATLSDITHHRELQKTKNDVIALVTHELRTPLTAIQGLSEVLTDHDVDVDQQRKMFKTINTEAVRLAKMINEYLDIARIEAGDHKPYFAPIEIKPLIERTILLLEPLAAKRNIKIVTHFDSDHPMVLVDAENLAQMITNIIANAIKYSPPNTTVNLDTRSDDEKFQIIVADKGRGISAEHLSHIFDKFYRVPLSGETGISGTGLGLALAQEVAEMHGGRITVESVPTEGSVFTIELPLRLTG